MTRHIPTSIITRRLGAGLSALAVLCALAIHIAPERSAQAAETAATSAYGVRILDADGEVRQNAAPLSEWSSGATVTNSLDSTGDFFKLNTTQSHHLSSRAASDGASASIESGSYQLRDRPDVAFTDLKATCTRDGGTEVSFGSLSVDGKNILNQDKLTNGYTYNLPDSDRYGSTTLHIAERASDANGRTTATALRIEGEAGASEIWRVQLGVVSCAAAPVVQTPAAASGITVTAQDGTPIIDQQPRIDTTGSVSSDTVESKEHHITASNISVKRSDDGSAHVSLDSFEQVPDTSDIGMYMWSALRVYGLSLDVKSDGSSSVSFAGGTSGVFVNGVWINSGTDLYTGMDANGNARVHVYFNERITNADGSITINALRYQDLTGAYPSVILGQTRWSPAKTPVDPEPNPTPDPSDDNSNKTGTLPALYAYGAYAQGPSSLGPVAASGPKGNDAKLPAAANADEASDGYAGQISASALTSSVTTERYTATVGSLTLYPGSSLETTLKDIAVSVGSDGAVTMTTAGGTVAGTSIPAGEVAANTRISIPGRSTTITLNAQDVDNGKLKTVSGVYVNDAKGLASEVRAAVISASAPAESPASPKEQPESSPESHAGHALGSGAISATSQNVSDSASAQPRHLASTGSQILWLSVSAAMLLVSAICVSLVHSRMRQR